MKQSTKWQLFFDFPSFLWKCPKRFSRNRDFWIRLLLPISIGGFHKWWIPNSWVIYFMDNPMNKWIKWMVYNGQSIYKMYKWLNFNGQSDNPFFNGWFGATPHGLSGTHPACARPKDRMNMEFPSAPWRSFCLSTNLGVEKHRRMNICLYIRVYLYNIEMMYACIYTDMYTFTWLYTFRFWMFRWVDETSWCLQIPPHDNSILWAPSEIDPCPMVSWVTWTTFWSFSKRSSSKIDWERSVWFPTFKGGSPCFVQLGNFTTVFKR